MEQKTGEGNEGFKKRQQTGSRGGCLKKGVAGTPLQTMQYKRQYTIQQG